MRSKNTMVFLRYIAANVRDLRRHAPLTQEQLAEAVDIDDTYLQRIEGAKANLSFDILVALADALEVHPARLMQEAELLPPKTGRPSRPRKKKGSKPSGSGSAPAMAISP